MIETGKYTEILSDYMTGFDFYQIPPPVIRYAKMVITDTIGVTWAAPIKKTPISRLITRFVHAVDGKEESTLIGSPVKCSAINAALANGTMAHDIIELDEVHNRAVTHSAAVIVPAALAVCEREGKSGKDLIAAVVLGFDIACRLAIALEDSEIYARGFHPTSVCGVFGAAAAAGHLLGLGKEEFRNAMALSGCQASGLIAWETETHHMSKSFQSGMAARNGVTAALMAQMEYQGPPAIFDGKYNVFDAFSGKRNYHLLTEGLGSRFEIMGAGLKRYSSCRHTHTVLDAFMKVIGDHRLTPQLIKRVEVRATRVAALMTDNNELPTHNVQLILSMAAFDGKVCVEQYLHKRYEDPEIQDFSKRIAYTVDPELTKDYPEKWSAIVTVETHDGRRPTAQVDYPKGDPQNPFSQEEIEEKFLGLTGEDDRKDKALQVVLLLRDLESLDTLSGMTRLLGG